VAENQLSGTLVGTLSSTDPDAGNTFTYSLVSGTGSDDNASFTIFNNQLLTNATFNYEAKNSYSIRVRTTDQGGVPANGGLSFEKVFTITVTDVNEQPTITSGSTASVPENTTSVMTVTATDPDTSAPFNTLSYSISGGADASKFTINSSTGALSFNTAGDDGHCQSDESDNQNDFGDLNRHVLKTLAGVGCNKNPEGGHR